MSRGRSHAEVLSMRRKGTLPPFLKWTGGFPRKVDEVVFQYPLVTFHDWRAGMENELLAAWLAMVRDQPDLEPSRCVCCGRCTKNKSPAIILIVPKVLIANVVIPHTHADTDKEVFPTIVPLWMRSKHCCLAHLIVCSRSGRVQSLKELNASLLTFIN